MANDDAKTRKLQIQEFRRRAIHLRNERDELANTALEIVEESGLLDLISFGELNIVVTNGVIQEFYITSSHRPSRQKAIGQAKTSQA